MGTVTSSSRTFPINNKEAPKASFLSEMQNVVQRRTQQPQPPSQPQQHSNTLADQLRSRLEERRKSKEEEEQPQQPQVQQQPQNAAFVPEAMAADIQKAVKMANETKPTDTGIIPPQFRKAHQVSPQQQSINVASNHQPETNGDKKQPHQWSSSPVEEWAKEQVCQWLLALGMESYITLFMGKTITGAAL